MHRLEDLDDPVGVGSGRGRRCTGRSGRSPAARSPARSTPAPRLTRPMAPRRRGHQSRGCPASLSAAGRRPRVIACGVRGGGQQEFGHRLEVLPDLGHQPQAFPVAAAVARSCTRPASWPAAVRSCTAAEAGRPRPAATAIAVSPGGRGASRTLPQPSRICSRAAFDAPRRPETRGRSASSRGNPGQRQQPPLGRRSTSRDGSPKSSDEPDRCGGREPAPSDHHGTLPEHSGGAASRVTRPGAGLLQRRQPLPGTRQLRRAARGSR